MEKGARRTRKEGCGLDARAGGGKKRRMTQMEPGEHREEKKGKET